MYSSVLVSFLEILYLYFTVVSSHSININESISRIPRQVDNGCVLPPYPQFGWWTIYQTSSQLKTLRPGISVPSGTILHVNCQNEYKLEGDTAPKCFNGKWTSTAGPCLQTCPPLHSTSRMTVTCTFNNGRKKNCEEATDGTRAHFVCPDFYEDQGLDGQPYSVCFYGNWSRSNPPECVPICGQKTSKKSPTLIIGGVNATRGENPWQVALYNITDKKLLCGGSLLNQRVVLTAAHCVTDDNNGKLLSTDLFMVAAGKYFRNYFDPRDSQAQFSQIYDMYIPKNYRGDIQNYFGDIAVIITKKAFVLSTSVQPVCVDWTFKHSPLLLDSVQKKYGYVSGWGYTTENDKPSDVLKELQVPLLDSDKCYQELPEQDRRFMTDDKLCAGYLDSGTSVCRGDSGGGLVSQHGGRYYLIGVVSLSPQAPTAVGGCDSQQYALYTNISYYIKTFILEKEAQFRPSAFGDVDCENNPNCEATESTTTTTSTTLKSVTQTERGNCIFPQHPKSGQWKIFGAGADLSPGMSVSSGTILRMSCNEGHRLVGEPINLCDNGEWSSKNVECLRFQSSPLSRPRPRFLPSRSSSDADNVQPQDSQTCCQTWEQGSTQLPASAYDSTVSYTSQWQNNPSSRSSTFLIPQSYSQVSGSSYYISPPRYEAVRSESPTLLSKINGLKQFIPDYVQIGGDYTPEQNSQNWNFNIQLQWGF